MVFNWEDLINEKIPSRREVLNLSMALRSGGIFLPLSFAIFAPGTITNLSATLSMVLSTAAALLAVFLGAAGNPLFFGLAISALCLVPCWLRHR